MANYRRWRHTGRSYFLTLVTHSRRPILTTEQGRLFLRRAISCVRQRHPFSLVATVLLPDHWHLVMKLPRADDRYSLRIKQIKTVFGRQWIDAGLPEARRTRSQTNRGMRGIWQPRFWEHLIRDENDRDRCFDYIHWNPRKHGLVERVVDWKWSSFHRFVKLGSYEPMWGGSAPDIGSNVSWGEP